MQATRALAGVILLATACGRPAKTVSPAPISIASVAAPAPAVLATSPNEADPAIATARRLFPEPFGLTPGREAVPSKVTGPMLYTSLATQLEDSLPSVSCMNLLGQPGAMSAGLNWVADEGTRGAINESHLLAAGPLLFRDRRSGHILAIPAGAKGVLQRRLTEEELMGYPDQFPPDAVAQLFLEDEIYVIDPLGKVVRSKASVEVTQNGHVRLCGPHPALNSSQCESENPAPPDITLLPYEYDLRRCAKGCEALCEGETDELDCSSPPGAMCIDQVQRLFLSGVDVGSECLYDEWDVRCARGCTAGRCDTASPVFNWRVELGDTSNLAPVLLRPDRVTLIVNSGELATVSSDGRILRREKLSTGSVLYLASDATGVAYTLDTAGVLTATGEKRVWQATLAKSSALQRAGLTVSRGVLYAALTAKLWALDAASGHARWTADLNGNAVGPPLVLRSNQIAQASEKELALIDAAGKVQARSALAAKPIAVALMASDQVLLATDDGALWLGAPGALQRVAPLVERPSSLLALAGGALVVTSGKKLDDGYTLRYLELPSGRQSWRHKLDDFGQPLVDRRGGILVASSPGMKALSAKGDPAWEVDLRGRSFPRAVLGPDETVYLQDDSGLSRWTLPH